MNVSGQLAGTWTETGRCLLTEVPAGEQGVRCPEEPAYRLWLDGCPPCREAGLSMGITGLDCVGHEVCVQHGARLRTGDLATVHGGSLIIRRIRSLAAAGRKH